MKEFHDGKKGKKADLAKWGEGFKLQGPTYGVTTHMVYFLVMINLECFSKSWTIR
jgi:hypothetical protein